MSCIKLLFESHDSLILLKEAYRKRERSTVIEREKDRVNVNRKINNIKHVHCIL